MGSTSFGKGEGGGFWCVFGILCFCFFWEETVVDWMDGICAGDSLFILFLKGGFTKFTLFLVF